MAPPVRKPSPPLSTAARFRKEIEAAIAVGATVEAMTLRLTMSDANRIRRDPIVPLVDISYDEGIMRFLGVRVIQGGVDASALEQSGANALGDAAALPPREDAAHE